MLTREEILEDLCSSVLRANQSYKDMSGGWSLQDSGIESYVSAEVARSICSKGRAKDGEAYCILEAGPKVVFLNSGASGTQGPIPKTYRQSGRIDVVYFNKRHQPVGLIEVKRYFGWNQMENDVKRLRWVLKRCGPDKGGSVRWGAVVGFHTHWDSSRKTLQDRLDAFSKRFTRSFKDLKSYSRIAPNSNDSDSEPVRISAAGFFSAAVLFRMSS